MTAIIKKQMKSGVKTVSGKVIMKGAMSVTVAVNKPNGDQTLKKFNYSDCLSVDFV